MKKLIAIGTIALTLSSLSAFAQGTIQFANNSASRIYANDIASAQALTGTDVFGPTVFVPAGNTTLRVGLYFSASENGTYVKAADTGFSALSAGRFAGGPIAIPGVAGGSSAWFQVRVWESSYAGAAATYEAAEAAGIVGARGSMLGMSNKQQLTTGTLTPTVLATGLQSFGVTAVVPEPSTIALGLLGLAGLFIIRRRQ